MALALRSLAFELTASNVIEQVLGLPSWPYLQDHASRPAPQRAVLGDSNCELKVS